MGKKKQFDETKVLRQVAMYFWEHGYAATRVDQLAALTGLTKTSLYNAYGNKGQLFLTAARLYVDEALNGQLAAADMTKPLSENHNQFLHTLFIECDEEERSYGCLVTNSIVELAANEPELYDEVIALSESIRERFRQLFVAYSEQGSLNSNLSMDELTDFFVTFMQGLRVISRKQQPEVPLRNAIKTLVTMVQSLER